MRPIAFVSIVGLTLAATNAVGQETLPAADGDRVVTLPKTVAKLRSGEPVRIVCFGDSVTGVYYHTHPNMDGHKRIAELMARSIGGRETSLADVPPPARPLEKTLALIKSGRPVKILAMPPFDEWIGPALSDAVPDAQLEITAWQTAGKTLSEIEQDAKARVRPMKPDLVMIAVPRTAAFNSEEAFISGYTWIMNWSLSFATQEWDCVVVHPAVVDSDHAEARYDTLVRQLVRAQDLTFIDRSTDETQSGKEIFVEWLKRQVVE